MTRTPLKKHSRLILPLLVFLSIFCINLSIASAASEKGKVVSSFLSDDAFFKPISLSITDCVTVKNEKNSFALSDKQITWSANVKLRVDSGTSSDYAAYWYSPDGALFATQTPKPILENSSGLKTFLVIDKDKMKDKTGLWKIEAVYKNVPCDSKYFYLLESGSAEIKQEDISTLEDKITKNKIAVKVREEADRLEKAKEIEEAKIAHAKKIEEESRIEELKVKEEQKIEQKPVDIPQVATGPVVESKNVMILEPLLVYENAYNEQRISAPDNSAQNIVNAELPAKASEILSNSGLVPIAINSLDNSQKAAVIAACDKLRDGTEELVKQWKDKSVFFQDFNLLKNRCNCSAILVQFVKAKVGNVGGWDFVVTGTVVPTTSTTTIKAVLINLNSGKIEWSNSAVERDLPQKYVIKNCLNKLFLNFPGYKNKKGES